MSSTKGMTHAQIAARARAPYADAIMKCVGQRERLREALERILEHNGDWVVAAIAREALDAVKEGK